MENEAAVIVAQVLGPLYLVVGLGLVAAPTRMDSLIAEMEASPGQTFTWGFIALGLGLVILAAHPGWTGGWQALVTLIGWIAVAKGALLLLVPDWAIGLTRRLMPSPARLRAWAVAPIALGVFLAVKGFGLG